MADFAGIEAVTSTLRQILLQRTQEPPSVTAAPPDVEVPDVVPPLVNLFLHRVSHNVALQNQTQPTGTLGQPPLALNLHYLLTARGSNPNDDRGAHRVLGDAMLTMNEHALIPKDDPLLDPGMVGEVELLKVTVEPLDVEDLSKIWTATTAPYRLAVGYMVTVVRLEPELPRPLALPVREPPDAGPRVYTIALDRPSIVAVRVLRRLPDGTTGLEQPIAYVRIGESLVVYGSGFRPDPRVLFDDVDATAGVHATSTDQRLVVEVPDDPALQPGVHRLELVREVVVGEPPDERTLQALRSGVAAFVLVPTVLEADPATGADGTTVTIRGQRLVAEPATTTVFVGRTAVRPAPGATATELQMTVAGLAPGTYPVRVRVGGAESIDLVTFEVIP
jgi:hypothetical protein